MAIWMGAKMTADETTNSMLIDFAPAWAILLLGIYAAVTIIYNVLTFNDCPEAAAELDQQIKEAKKEMKKRKIIQ